ncbi:MAG: transporter substrate-binding domain-containing protein [Syntrophomonadaceae bacterium]|nr:transporter substrate-binding domain-containing protein [Syntrophomonadaceae bacterium]
MKFIKAMMLGLFALMAISSTAYAASAIEFTPAEREFIKEHPVIRLGVDPEFVPYEFIDTDGQYKGIAADYIELLSERTGIKMEIAIGLTWPMAYERAASKQLDMLPCIARTIEREQYFIYSEPYYYFQRVIFVNNSEQSISGLEDLFYKRVAVKKNSSHHSYLKTLGAFEFGMYKTDLEALEAVAAGKEKYFVGNLATSVYVIKNNGLTNLKYIKVDNTEKQALYFAVRNDWPQLVGIINKGLGSITEEEKIAINSRWIGIENQVDYSRIIRTAVIAGTFILIIILVSWYWIMKLKKEVAQRIRVEEALKISKEEAEAANQFKSTFLARMSHEIRTPLNAITGMAYLIKKTGVTTTQSIYLEKITQASRNMLAIINDILDFSKIEAGKIVIERIPFNLDKVLQQVINIVAFKIEEQRVTFALDKDPHIPVYFWGDPTRLEQILLNVISNAVKFTVDGEVAVKIRLLARDNNICRMEFVVADTGIGMPTEQLNNLFKPFDQGDSSINRRYGGTGLGLSIVKSLVELLDGEISVYSSPGEGSTFVIQLALEVDTPKEDEDKQKSESIYFKKIQVLVLEKSPGDSDLLLNCLNSFNMPADFSASADTAVQLLRNDKKTYDLLIVDNDTPECGGVDFINEVKADPLIKSKPRTILLIPLMKEEIFEIIEKMNIDCGISKPIIASILHNGIIEIFKDKVMEMHDSSSNIDQAAGLLVDYPYHVLIVEDNHTNQFIARSILELAGFKISLADNGKAGLEFYKENRDNLHLILMDLHMPVMNGYDAARHIREIDVAIPIAAMSADAIGGVEEQCKKAGIDYYISKPFEPEKFMATILNIIKPLSKERQKLQDEAISQEVVSACDEAVLDENDGVRRLGNNMELYLMVLNEYYQENKDILLNLSSSISERRYQDAVQIVHKIKGSSGNIGARGFFDIASELQRSLAAQDESEIIKLHEQFEQVFKQLFDEIEQKIANL